MGSFLSLEGLDKRFGDLRVLAGVSLAVDEGEILALLGPSGSGKTTLLRLLAGFEVPDAGAIRVDGEDVTGLQPARRRFGMVFQHYALFPHLTVSENVAFGLPGRRGDRARVQRRVAEVLAQVDLSGFEGRGIQQLSGGQQQRVALARALAPEPRVLLLDEPLSNLDPSLRERTRRELREAIERVGITTVFVTHEQDEAFDLGGRVAVLHRGRLDQIGTPEELYERPATPFVAGFIGRNNLLRGVAVQGGVALSSPGRAEPVVWPLAEVEGYSAGEQVEIAVRPERLEMIRDPEAGGLAGTVRVRRYAGPVTYYEVLLESGVEVEVLSTPTLAVPGDRVIVRPVAAGPPVRFYRPETDRRAESRSDG